MARPFTITGCTVNDGLGLSQNNMTAFWQDNNWARSWRHVTLEHLITEQAKGYPQTLLENRSTTRHIKAINSDGKIIGYARWKLPESFAVVDGGGTAWPEAVTPAVSAEEETEIDRIAETVACKPINSQDDAEFDKAMVETKAKYIASKPYLDLDYLAVHPDGQGKGIASALIQTGLRQAKTLSLDTFVFAYQGAINLYTRQGFQVKEELVSKISGHEEPYRVCYMVCEQEPSKE